MNFGVASAGRAFGWLRRAFDLESTIQPAVDIEGIIYPTIDIFGTDRYRFQESTSAAGGAGSTLVSITVPPTEIWYVLSGHVIHTDGVAQNVWISLSPASPAGVPEGAIHQLAPSGVNANVPVPISRAFYAAPGTFVNGRAVALGGAATLGLSLVFLRLQLGEYTRT